MYKNGNIWLNGKYSWHSDKNKIEAEINTRLPFISIGDYFAQGQDADETIAEIFKLWIADGRRNVRSAIRKYVDLYGITI